MHRLFRHSRARHQAFRELAGRALPKRCLSRRRRQPRLEELEDRRLLSSGDANNLILMIADGQGFNVQLECVPLDGRITLRVATEKAE